MKKRIKHHPLIKIFGERLKQVRSKIGMSQAELAKKAQVNVGYVGKMERGQTAPGLDLVARVADALGIDTADLVTTEPASGASMAVVTEQLRSRLMNVIERKDLSTLHALSVLVGHVDAAQAHRNL